MQEMDKNIAPLLEALRFSPTNIPLKKHIAELMLQSRKIDEAIEQLQEILAQGEDTDCRVSLAKANYNSGDFQAAKANAEKALAVKPSADLSLLLSKICFSLEEYSAAGDYYQEALDLEPESEDADYQQELSNHNVQVKVKLHIVNFAHSSIQDDIVEHPTITFADVGGLEDLKENIKMNILYPFQNPSLFKAYGRKIGGGILLYGPPGCGKTFLARATAGECSANFINIAINDILDMYIGNSEKNLHQFFEKAREHTPTIVFIDELDAIGGSRQQMHYHHNRMLTNQLLNELDGVDSDNNEILVLGATNSPWFVDSSLRRPGRFDRVLFVPPPDFKARIEVLNIYLKDKPTEAIDVVKIAKSTEKYSGADLKAICDAATDTAITDAMRTGKIRPIRTEDVLNALKKTKPSTLEWLSTAKNYATYSNEAGTYDDILNFFKKS